MSNAPIQVSTTPPLPGAQLVNELNSALQALGTNFSGPTDPAANAGPYMRWADTGTGRLRMRNAAGTAWIDLGPLAAEATEPIDGALMASQEWVKKKLLGVLPIVSLANVPATDIGPVYVVGVGVMEWDTDLAQYAVRGELATRLTALDDSVDFAIVYPNGGSEGAPANVAPNTRYVVPNPFPGHRVMCLAEVQSGGVWGATGWYYASTARGVTANQYNDSAIVVQTGSQFLLGVASEAGGVHGNSAAVGGSLPCRVKVWKVKGAI